MKLLIEDWYEYPKCTGRGGAAAHLSSVRNDPLHRAYLRPYCVGRSMSAGPVWLASMLMRHQRIAALRLLVNWQPWSVLKISGVHVLVTNASS